MIKGLFNAATNFLEDAHSLRLENEWQDVRQKLALLDSDVRAAALIGFLAGRRQLMGQLRNWSRDGQIRMARGLMDEARRSFDLNLSKSYASWMAGAWLETQARGTERSMQVYWSLDGLARELESNDAVPAEKNIDSSDVNTIDVSVGSTHSNNRLVAASRGVTAQNLVRQNYENKIDFIQATQQANQIFHDLVERYFLAVNRGAIYAARMSSVISQLTYTEKEFLIAMLFGIWHSIISQYGKVADSEKVVSTSIAQWFDIPAGEASIYVQWFTKSSGRRDVIDFAISTTEAIGRFLKTRDVRNQVELIELMQRKIGGQGG